MTWLWKAMSLPGGKLVKKCFYLPSFYLRYMVNTLPSYGIIAKPKTFNLKCGAFYIVSYRVLWARQLQNLFFSLSLWRLTSSMAWLWNALCNAAFTLAPSLPLYLLYPPPSRFGRRAFKDEKDKSYYPRCENYWRTFHLHTKSRYQ